MEQQNNKTISRTSRSASQAYPAVAVACQTAPLETYNNTSSLVPRVSRPPRASCAHAHSSQWAGLRACGWTRCRRGEVCACASGSRGQKARERCAAGSLSAHTAGAAQSRSEPSRVPGPWSVSVTSVFMAFAPMGPEASFFDVLDQHRASLLAALRRGGGEPAGRGTCPASRYRAPATLAHAPGRWHAGRPPAAPQVPRPRAGQP